MSCLPAEVIFGECFCKRLGKGWGMGCKAASYPSCKVTAVGPPEWTKATDNARQSGYGSFLVVASSFVKIFCRLFRQLPYHRSVPNQTNFSPPAGHIPPAAAMDKMKALVSAWAMACRSRQHSGETIRKKLIRRMFYPSRMGMLRALPSSASAACRQILSFSGGHRIRVRA